MRRKGEQRKEEIAVAKNEGKKKDGAPRVVAKGGERIERAEVSRVSSSPQKVF